MFSFALCSSSLSHELILFTEPVGYSRLKVTGMIERSQRSKLHRASICPQQGDKIESLVLNMARVYIQILGGPVPPPPPVGVVRLPPTVLPFSTLEPTLVLFTSWISVTFNLPHPKNEALVETAYETKKYYCSTLIFLRLVVSSLKKADTDIE